MMMIMGRMRGVGILTMGGKTLVCNTDEGLYGKISRASSWNATAHAHRTAATCHGDKKYSSTCSGHAGRSP